MYESEVRRCLLEMDVAAMRRLWRRMSPQLAQPKTDQEALVTMHLARSEMRNIDPRLKTYSKRWLADHAPSFPKIAAAVGISVKTINGKTTSRTEDKQAAMSEAVLDAIKAGISIEDEPEEISRRMTIAREKI